MVWTRRDSISLILWTQIGSLKHLKKSSYNVQIIASICLPLTECIRRFISSDFFSHNLSADRARAGASKLSCQRVYFEQQTSYSQKNIKSVILPQLLNQEH